MDSTITAHTIQLILDEGAAKERQRLRQAVLDATVDFPDGRSESMMWWKRADILALIGDC